MPLLIKWSFLLHTQQQRLPMLFNGPDNPQIATSCGDLDPHLTHSSSDQKVSAPQTASHRFSRFFAAHTREQHSDTQTHTQMDTHDTLRVTSVAHAMRLINNNNYNILTPLFFTRLFLFSERADGFWTVVGRRKITCIIIIRIITINSHGVVYGHYGSVAICFSVFIIVFCLHVYLFVMLTDFHSKINVLYNLTLWAFTRFI